MYRSREELNHATDAELLDFSTSRVPTLRQMHAIEALAVRARATPELMEPTVARIAAHLGHAWRLGGLPVGYLGALELYKAAGEPRARLLAAIATAPQVERDDLLRWLTDERPARPPQPRPPVEREILIERRVGADTLQSALGGLVGRTVEAEVIDLPGAVATAALVALTLAEWEALDRSGERLAAELGSTVYLWPPEAYYSVHPDLRLAVSPEQGRSLVVVESAGLGYRVHRELMITDASRASR